MRVGDNEIAYFCMGDPKNPPLLLCHGLAANSLQFVKDAAFYAEQGYFTIVPDLRGHGRSVCPQNRTDAAFSIPALAADIVAILDELNIESTHWVGNSLGGLLALSLMQTDPSRLKSFTSFGTSYSLSIPGFAVGLILGVHRLLGRERMAKISGALASRFKPVKAMVTAMIRQSDMDVVARITRHLASYDFRQPAREFDGPVLMIRGERDADINKALKSTLPQMLPRPGFKLVDLKDAGHFANLDQPEKTREYILDFLQS